MTVIDGGQRCRQLFGGRGATCMHHDGRMRFSCGALSLSSYVVAPRMASAARREELRYKGTIGISMSQSKHVRSAWMRGGEAHAVSCCGATRAPYRAPYCRPPFCDLHPCTARTGWGFCSHYVKALFGSVL